MQALAEVLKGTLAPRGRLPVELLGLEYCLSRDTAYYLQFSALLPSISVDFILLPH